MTDYEIRRQLYEQDKLLYSIQPYGHRLYSCLQEVLAIAEKYESRDSMIDARAVLRDVELAIKEMQ